MSQKGGKCTISVKTQPVGNISSDSSDNLLKKVSPSLVSCLDKSSREDNYFMRVQLTGTKLRIISFLLKALTTLISVLISVEPYFASDMVLTRTSTFKDDN